MEQDFTLDLKTDKMVNYVALSRSNSSTFKANQSDIQWTRFRMSHSEQIIKMNDEIKSELRSPELPEGTVTFIFTDIEGSTELLKELGDKYAAVLADQRRILRDIFSRWSGQEVDTQGDSFFVSFPRATEAVAAAVEIQKALSEHTWPEDVEVRLRIGIHTGEPLVAEEGYVGIDVHRAARIGNTGHGGQVLLSETTTALVIDDLPLGVRLADLGQHRLKDVHRPEHIHQLTVEGLPTKFPPLKSIEVVSDDGEDGQPKHNLPPDLTPFIGREEELDAIQELMRDKSHRLLTLVGVGGIGKTRLALKAVSELVDRYPDGVRLVELANLSDPDLVPQYVASVYGVSAREEGREVTDVLIAYLSEKSALMVLDNCEHLIEPCAILVEKLLIECPGVNLIATSRENLGVQGEISFPVPTMEVPKEQIPAGDFELYEAVRLFVDRAKAALPAFDPSFEAVDPIVKICRQLDGIPLAIELAAARVKLLEPAQITDRLQDRLDFLAGGPRTALPRHQTLEATMEWSYSLLTADEKDQFIKLSVFAGGWSLENAESLMRVDPGEPAEISVEIIDVLSNLVDKSLVVVERREGVVRYRMLEPVRQFAVSKLSESGFEETIRKKQADLFKELAGRADPKLRTTEQLMWLEILDREHENLRTAISWLLKTKQVDGAAKLIGDLGWYWWIRGLWLSAWKWLTLVLESDIDPIPAIKARAVYRTAGLDVIRGKLTGRLELVEDALEICTNLNDTEGMAWCLNLLGQAMTHTRDDLDKGVADLTKSIELFQSFGDSWGVAWSTRYLGQIRDLQDDFEESVVLQRRALEGFEEIGDTWNVAHSLYLYGLALQEHGELEEARRQFEQCYSKCKTVKDEFIAAHALQGIGMVELDAGQYDEAEVHLRDALDVMQRIGDEGCSSRVLGCLSSIAQAAGDLDKATSLQRESLRGNRDLHRTDRILMNLVRLASLAMDSGLSLRAARVLGAAEAYFEEVQSTIVPVTREEYERIVDTFSERRENEEFKQNYADGYALSFEEALAYALGDNEVG
jgi:predicted ATPase/class 3 adenylate cyclase